MSVWRKKNYVGTTVNSGMKDKGAIFILMVYNIILSIPPTVKCLMAGFVVNTYLEKNWKETVVPYKD